MFSFQSLHQAIYQHGVNNFSFKVRGGLEQAISWHDLQKDYLTLANEYKKMGLSNNPVIAILSTTRYEWTVVDFATQAIGGITVGLYKNDRDSVLLESLKQTQPDLLVVENYQELKRIQAIDSDWGWTKPIIIMDAAFQSAPPIYHLNIILSKQLQVSDRSILDTFINNQSPDRIASYIFTSGTSGTPKATALTMKNLMHSARVYESSYKVTDQDSTILYLPFSHVFSRVMFYASVLWGQQHYYVSNMEQLPEELKRIAPSVFLAVPRLLEKVKKAIEFEVNKKSVIQNLIYQFAIEIGKLKNTRKKSSFTASILYPIADRLVLNKLREAFGARIRFMGAGGGKLSQSIAEYFWSIGIPVYEGYASTESGGLGIFNHPNSVKLGSIGHPPTSVDYKILDDGELLIKSPSNAKGYLVNGEIEPFSEWLSTGDIVNEDINGFLKVVDRKKDIMVSSYGKNIAPTWIEEQFMQSPLIDDIVISGDDRPYVSALIVISPSVSKIKTEHQLDEEMIRINQKLSRHERIKAYLVVPEFDIDSATMTATFKKRRSAILNLYRSEIDHMYQPNNQLMLATAQ